MSKPVVPHDQAARQFIADEARTNWHDQTLWFVRQKRDKAAHTLPDWESLRDLASGIKDYALANLSTLLTNFERQAMANGITVHWATDAAEHNRIVLDLIRQHSPSARPKVVKSKSMLTEECHLNEFLTEQGVDLVDTDLGERIVQLRQSRRVILCCPLFTCVNPT